MLRGKRAKNQLRDFMGAPQKGGVGGSRKSQWNVRVDNVRSGRVDTRHGYPGDLDMPARSRKDAGGNLHDVHLPQR